MTSTPALNDGLCRAAITMQARQLLSTVCVLGGADCPLIAGDAVRGILDQLKRDPTVTVRLESSADEVPYYTLPDEETDFEDKSAEIGKVTIKGVRGEDKDTPTFMNSFIAAWMLGKLNLKV